MVREAVKVELTNSTGNIRRLTCATGTRIPKGSLLKLTDPRTAVISDAASAAALVPNAGIASEEQEATDTKTSIAVWTDGIFEVTASGSITLGAPVTFVNGNYVIACDGAASGACIAGYSLETCSTNEVFNMRLRL